MADHWYDTEVGGIVINETELPTSQVIDVVSRTSGIDSQLSVASQSMNQWFTQTRNRKGGIFDRDKYVTPRLYFEQFQVAEHAVEYDDVVSGVMEMTEALAFSKISLEADDPDEEDVWNQVARDLDLDARLREMWHDLFTFSQVYVAAYWGNKSYKVRGKTDKGNARRKTFDDLKVPLGVTILDPRKVIPVGTFMFNQENLVYLAADYEAAKFDAVLNGSAPNPDPIVQQMILGEYEFPGGFLEARKYLSSLGYFLTNIQKMYMLNPQNVWRHTLTRPQWKQMASVRMKAIFDLLDLKNQLKEMDRATLIGATNFIILITKGSDTRPATAGELKALSGYAQISARVPVIIGDHRLNIQIITPKTDHTLDQSKYDLIDTRVTARLFQMFVNPKGRQEDSSKLARVIARGMENRRHMLRRSVEKFLLNPTYLLNDQFTSEPSLEFRPKRIALDFDTSLGTFMLDLRDRGELSRDSLLSEFDFDQEDEARKRVSEKERYDKIFETAVPFNSPGNNPNATNPAPGASPDANPKRPNSDQTYPGAATTTVTVSHPAPAPAGQKPAGNTDPKAAGRNRGGNRNGGGASTPSATRGKTKEQQK